MRVLIDLDGVVADWGLGYDRWARWYNLYLFGGIPYAERTTWDLCLNLTPEGVDINKRIMEMPGFYCSLQPLPGAVDAVERLIRAGHDVWFVSTPHPHNPTCASDKYAWVEEHFGFEMKRKTILTDDKTLIKGDVLIDDRPLIEGVDHPSWKHLCFGEYGYSSSTDSKRVPTWADARAEVLLLQWEMDLAERLN
jgi:5'-nucleotidase